MIYPFLINGSDQLKRIVLEVMFCTTSKSVIAEGGSPEVCDDKHYYRYYMNIYVYIKYFGSV